jgi:hypothetical protein
MRHTIADSTLGDRAGVGQTESSAGEGQVGELHVARVKN